MSGTDSNVRAIYVPAEFAQSATAWRGAPLVALLLVVVSAIRLHELVPATSVLQPALLATFGGLGLLLARTPELLRKEAFSDRLSVLIMAYWGFMIVTMPFALWPGLAAGMVRYMLPGVAMVLAIRMCAADRRTLNFLLTGFVLAASAYALYARVSGRMWDGRLSAGTGMYDSNDMAAIMAVAFPLAVGLVRHRSGAMRLLLIGAALLLATVALASGSRGGTLGLGAGAIVLAFGLKGNLRIGAVTLLAIATLGLWNFSPSFNERMSSLTNLEEDYNMTDEVGRKQVWKRGRQYIRENPVIGVGAGNFPIAEGDYFAVMYYGTRGAKWSSAHNAYIQAYAELGLIGGSIFVGLLLFGVARSWRHWRGTHGCGGLSHQPELLAALCAYMVSAIFLSHAYFMPLFALLGMIVLADRVRRTEANAEASADTFVPVDSLTPPQLRKLRSNGLLQHRSF
jgi:O-antigen ligase